MKTTKSIFDKSYLIEAQAIKAGEKEWPQGTPNTAMLGKDEATNKWRWIKVTPAAEKTIAEEYGPSDFDLANAAAEARDADRQANASMGTIDAKPRISTCERPTKKVWDIADSMPKASRKDVMAACVAQGIAYGTARTQYQAWFKASQECERLDIRQPHQKGE